MHAVLDVGERTRLARAKRIEIEDHQHALDSGLVAREAIGRTYIYQVVRESPLFEPLELLLERTVNSAALSVVTNWRAAMTPGP